MRRIPIPTLLLTTLLAAPLAAQIEGGVRVQPRAQAPGNGSTIVIWPRHLQTLQARLDSFAIALPEEERALWYGVLLRAAHAPTPAAAEVRVRPVLEIGPGGGCEDAPGMTEAAGRVAIIVQGGRTAGASGIVVQGGRTATPGAGIVVQGGRTSGGVAPATTRVVRRPGAQGAEVRRPTEAVAIGPKQEDPARPTPEMLGRRLTELSSRLPDEERGALNWLLTRAATAPEGPGGLPPGAAVATTTGEGRPGPGGLPPGPCMCETLRQALGIDPLAIGPKPEDPGRGRTEERWILRF
jgi:hypothetical protein